jgi:hypothetical protein
MPSDFASVLRRFADRTSLCAQRTGAHRARHPSGFFPCARSPRHRGPHLGGILPQKQGQELAFDQRRCERSLLRSAGMHGFVDQRAVRGAEHRRQRRRRPEGARARCARVGCSTWMYCQPTPPLPRSAGQFDSHDANRTTAVGARPFWLLFGAMPKSDPRSGAARKLCTIKSNPLARRASGTLHFKTKASAAQRQLACGNPSLSRNAASTFSGASPPVRL